MTERRWTGRRTHDPSVVRQRIAQQWLVTASLVLLVFSTTHRNPFVTQSDANLVSGLVLYKAGFVYPKTKRGCRLLSMHGKFMPTLIYSRVPDLLKDF